MSKGKLKICVITGSRAEYGLLQPLMRLIKKDKSVQLQLLVTGMHLSPEFGLTYQQIQQDGYRIDEKVEMLLSADTPTAISKATGLGLIGFADALGRLQPDWVVVLGDRFETFAATVAAHFAKIPVAHLHGGELTEGATDDAMRHAISKMAYLHFTAADEYRNRVIQLGEQPKRVFNTGAIGLDSINETKTLSKKELEKQLQFRLSENTLLITYHPVTLDNNTAAEQLSKLLNALDKFPNATLLFTLPNADADGRIIIERIKEYVNKNSDHARAFTSLGQLKYYSVLKYAKAIVGNSSSGIIEAPHFKLPTINIGDRQKGRIRAASVIDSSNNSEDIAKAIRKALSTSFIASKKTANPYGKGGAAAKILNIIKKTGRPVSIKKTFYDLPQ